MTATEANPLAGSDFQPQQQDLELDRPPTFATAAEERAHRKQRLAGALRVIGKLGFAEGVAGHITARDPELLDHFWVNPFGKSFKQMKVSDLILVNPNGEVVHGNKPVNTAAYAIHHAIHEARPDVMCAVHTHTVHGRAFAALDEPLRMISQDACMFLNDWVRHKDGGGAIVVGPDEAGGMAAALGDKKAMIHHNHGIITAGDTVEAAAWWFMALERACEVQLIAMAAGELTEVKEEYAEFTFKQSGFGGAGWFQFQPHWEDLIASDGTDWMDE